MSIIDFIVKKGDGVFEKLGSCNDSQIATAALAGFKLFFIPFATLSDKQATKEQKEYAATRDFLTEVIALTTYLGITAVAQRNGTTSLCLGYYKNKAKLIKEGKIPGVDPKLFTNQDFEALEKIDKKTFKTVMFDMYHKPKNKPAKATVAEKNYMDKLIKVIEKFQKVFPDDPKRPGTFLGNIKYDFTNLFNKKLKIQLPNALYKNVKLNISQMSIWILAVFVIPPMCNILLKPVLGKFKEMQAKKNESFVEPEKSDVYPTHNAQMNEVKKVSFNGYYNVGNIGNMRVGM